MSTIYYALIYRSNHEVVVGYETYIDGEYRGTVSFHQYKNILDNHYQELEKRQVPALWYYGLTS